MSYMNESAWPGPDTAGNEAEDSGVIQATPENEAADTSGVQGTSEELRTASPSAGSSCFFFPPRFRAGFVPDGSVVSASGSTAAVSSCPATEPLSSAGLSSSDVP